MAANPLFNATWPITQVSTRNFKDSQNFTFDDATIQQLTAPAGANLAEIEVQGGTVRYMIGSDPTNTQGKILCDGDREELESVDEINLFRIIGEAGQNGIIIIHYFSHNKRNS